MSEVKPVGLSLVVAMAKNRVIGRDNGLPWHLPKDLAYFKKITMGHPIIMGRKTFDSIGRPLPGRTNIVVTRQAEWCHEGVLAVGSLQEAITLAEEVATQDGLKEIMLIGGASLYEQALTLASKLYLTEVQANVDGDTLFPEYDASAWKEFRREPCVADETNPYDYAFVAFNRIID